MELPLDGCKLQYVYIYKLDGVTVTITFNVVYHADFEIHWIVVSLFLKDQCKKWKATT